MLASVLIITLQLPLARFARRVGAVNILPVGFLLLSAAFASVAMFAATEPPEGWLRLLPSVSFVTLLTLGQMLLVPSAKDLIPRFADESTLGAHYGALFHRRRHCGTGWKLVIWQPAGSRAGAFNAGDLPVAAAGALSTLQRAGPERDLPPATKLIDSLFRAILLRQFRHRTTVIHQMTDGQNGVTP